MCGIAGYVQLAGNPTFALSTLLERMQQKLAHRGPDGQGVWVHSDEQIGIAHTRLSIIDTSVAGTQPMWNKKRTVIVSYNGELYNYRALQKELEKCGHTFFTQSDTEVLLAAYDEWGIACLEKFEGMFAIILVDSAKNEIYIIRDRIGVKPLFFATDGSTYLGCASEIKALWEIEPLKKEPCSSGIQEYLQYLQPFAPKTVYKNVFVLPPGHLIHINAQRTVTYHQWYDVLKHAPQISHPAVHDIDAWVQLIDTTLQNAIQKRLVADVPVGAFLSGGLDSSLIASIMSKYQQRVKTFTVHIEGNGVDEREWAQQVAAHIKSEHYSFEIPQKEYLQTLNEMQSTSDQPMGDPLSAGLAILARHMKQQGVSVALFGEGADELFGGYPSYLRYQQINPFFKCAQKLPKFMQCLLSNTLRPFSSNRPIFAHALDSLESNQSLFKTSSLGLYQPARIVSQTSFEEAHHATLCLNFAAKYNQLKLALPASDFLTQLAYGELLHRIPQVLLTRFDHMTMHHAVEGRVPYLDYHVIALAMQLPSHLKIKGSEQKWILKKIAEKYLPPTIIYRPKVGFTAPLPHLLQQQKLDKQLQALLLSRRDRLSEVLNIQQVQEWCATYQHSPQHALPLWLMHQLCSLDMFI
jgi:asparagine synthase (glutamine-hydrolysing)